MHLSKGFKWWLALLLPAAFAMQGVRYVWALNSDVYQAAAQWAKTSPEVAASVGKVREVHHGFFDAFGLKLRERDSEATIEIRVVGDSGEIRILAVLDKVDGSWRVRP